MDFVNIAYARIGARVFGLPRNPDAVVLLVHGFGKGAYMTAASLRTPARISASVSDAQPNSNPGRRNGRV